MAANGMHLCYYKYFTVLSYVFAARTDCHGTHKSSTALRTELHPSFNQFLWTFLYRFLSKSCEKSISHGNMQGFIEQITQPLFYAVVAILKNWAQIKKAYSKRLYS